MEADGRIRTTFSHNPSTLRFASQNPNLQNLPRPNSRDPNDISNLIRGMIVAGKGNILCAADFSGIEAVLVGWEAGDPNYVRLARRDVHSFYTAYAIHALEPKRFLANDLPLLSWDDDKFFTRLGEIKKEFGWDRNNLYKHLIHAINFGQEKKGAQATIYKATNVNHEVSVLGKLMGLYREDLFPLIPKWQLETQRRADRDGYLRNAFGYVHHFFSVFDRKRYKVGGEWVVNSRPGTDCLEGAGVRASIECRRHPQGGDAQALL